MTGESRPMPALPRGLTHAAGVPAPPSQERNQNHVESDRISMPELGST